MDRTRHFQTHVVLPASTEPMRADPLLRKHRSADPFRRDIDGVCGFCTRDPHPLPPFGFGRLVEGDPRNIVMVEHEWLVCRDCYRRGRRWRDAVFALHSKPTQMIPFSR